MGDVAALLRLLITPRSIGVVPRRLAGWVIAVICILSILYALACAMAVGSLVKAIRAAQWDFPTRSDFLTGGIKPAFAAAYALVMLIISVRTNISRQQKVAGLQMLRRAAATGDESLAPPAEWLLTELRNESVPAVPARFGPLPPISTTLGNELALWGSVLSSVGAFCVVLCLLLALANTASDARSIETIFVITGGVAVLVGFVLLHYARQLRRPVTVLADENGLRWVGPGRHVAEQRLDWHDARAFFVIQYSDTEAGASRHVAFVLDSLDNVLVWDEWFDNKPDMLGASDSLCAVILARTELPLYDLSDLAAKLSAPRWKPAYAALFDILHQLPPESDPLLPGLPTPITLWHLLRPAIFLGAALLGLLAAMWLIGNTLPD